jgi:hypothetical protein
MKKALVTIAAGEYFARMAALTHPTLRAYADKVGADFIVWSDVSGYKIAEYKKMEVGALLDVYDRVLCVDTDIIIVLIACWVWIGCMAKIGSIVISCTTPARAMCFRPRNAWT